MLKDKYKMKNEGIVNENAEHMEGPAPVKVVGKDNPGPSKGEAEINFQDVDGRIVFELTEREWSKADNSNTTNEGENE